MFNKICPKPAKNFTKHKKDALSSEKASFYMKIKERFNKLHRFPNSRHSFWKKHSNLPHLGNIRNLV